MIACSQWASKNYTVASSSLITINTNEYIIPLSQTIYVLSCTLPDEAKIIRSINFFMVWITVNWGYVEGCLIERTFKGFAFVEIVGRTFQKETYGENSYGFGFVSGKRGSLCWNKHSEKIQLFWKGIHLVSGNGFLFKLYMLSLLINFTQCPSKKKILPSFKLICTSHIFPMFFIKYVGYKLHNSTFRYLYETIRSDLSGC